MEKKAAENERHACLRVYNHYLDGNIINLPEIRRRTRKQSLKIGPFEMYEGILDMQVFSYLYSNFILVHTIQYQ